IVATGGLASLMGGGSKYIREIDDLLTLEGLRIIYERNQAHVRRRNEHAAGNETPEGGSARETIGTFPKPDRGYTGIAGPRPFRCRSLFSFAEPRCKLTSI